MFDHIPHTAGSFVEWRWPQFEPLFADLRARTLTKATAAGWLSDWSRVAEYVEETYWRLYVATNTNTQDQGAEAVYQVFLNDTQPAIRDAEQHLKQKLIASQLEPEGFEIALRNMRAEAELYRDSNLSLLADEKSLGTRYQQVRGAQTVEWNGQELPLLQMNSIIASSDRTIRESAWRLMTERRLADREAINELWSSTVNTRHRLAQNAELPNFLTYRWRQLFRFHYTPENCSAFHAAIREVCVPAASRIFERRRKRLGIARLRPWDAAWDLHVDQSGLSPLKPFESIDELVRNTSAVFNRLDPALGAHFDLMAREGLLDLEVRPSKAAGAYCTTYASSKRPFIFMNAVGLHNDLLTLIHESGHAFHWCESYDQPYFQNRGLDFQPVEFVEVASTVMEFMSTQLYAEPEINFYSKSDAVRAEIEHLETALLFWPNMALMDAFQMWVYTHEDKARNSEVSDAKWVELHRHYIPDIDWTGLDSEVESAWQLKGILFEAPLYYVEYGLAQLAAVHIWDQSRSDRAGTLARYRSALSLGSTRSLPELYKATGVELAWDIATLRRAVGILEARLDELLAIE